MLLRNSITNTKKFFQKTINNVKSFLTKGSTYQRLPKTPQIPPFSCGRDTNQTNAGARFNDNELDYFYTEFTNQWDSHKSKKKNKAQKKTNTKKTQHFFRDDSSEKENCNNNPAGSGENARIPEKIGDFDKRAYVYNDNIIENEKVLNSKRFNLSPSINTKKYDQCSRSVKEKRFCFVAEKLKELEVIDKGNVDHKLDFQEFLNYYSRLSCPAYLDIVDNYLMEICREFFGPQGSSKVSYSHSRPVLQALQG